MTMTMQMWMLPAWLRAAWVVVFCAVVALHLHHAWVMQGQRRYWHVGHVVMGVGMAYMYLPHPVHLLPASSGVVGFAIAALVSAIAAVWFWHRDGIFNPLWGLSMAEMAVMSYMFLPTSTRPTVLSYGLAFYLLGQGVLWALGVWDRYLVDHQRLVKAADGRRTQPFNISKAARLADPSVPTVQVSLVAMTAGMAYMLLAM
jgi:hypothetical protein